MAKLSRRAIIKAPGASILTAAGLVFNVAKADEPSGATTAALGRHSAGPNDPSPITYIFFETDETAFVEAAVSRLIPADEQWPGALEAGVPNYIDKQLARAWAQANGCHMTQALLD